MESSGETQWESAEQSLIMNFIVPLARKLIKVRGRVAIAKEIGLSFAADEDDIIDRMVAEMVNPINLAQVKQALDAGNRSLALKRANSEAKRYQRDVY